MQTGVRQGMRLMDDALYGLLNQGLITPETAMERANDRSKFVDLSKMRANQVNWTQYLLIQDDKKRMREMERKRVAVYDRKEKKWRIPPKKFVPFMFYQEVHGKLPEDEIYQEIQRLYPEYIIAEEDGGLPGKK
jgi:hypothetical protein